MRFELDNVLTDEIIFYMENQDSDFVLDSQKKSVVDIFNNAYDEGTDFGAEERFIPLPVWEPKDGYRLMEKFAASLKNPVVRQELSSALNRNKGVFRAYRNVLEGYPEIEKMWFSFKEQKMKNEVILWYNSLREEWGLEPVGGEPEDNSSLVLEDFFLREGNGDFCFIAETADGDIAGSISANLSDSTLCIGALEVKSEYRGMGIGKTLLAKLLEKADERGLDVTIDLPSNVDFFSRSLHLENFTPCMQRFVRRKS
ncbi:MAG: GNAT family N-acetyltransferase [Treponema sp.]|jgi:GNAT superfamily N-acetyltransferase|nr:GNAT family N-acetyltransferase [Treponema sp.]